MTTGHVFIATSLDGFVARQDDSLDWLMKQDQQGQDLGYEAFMQTVDGLIMGRGSFQTVLGFDAPWPYEVPVVVMSSSLRPDDVPAELRDQVRITSDAPSDVMAALDADGWKRAYVDGGLLVQSFLRAGLIEDLIITTIPILIGDGKRLFGALDADLDLELVRSESFASGAVQTEYRIRRG